MGKKPLTVLIIDDSPEDHELYREYLNTEPETDYHFIDAYTGAQGEKLYGEHPVDCVLIDYRLPDFNGLELLRRLCSKQEIVPAVILTGDGNETVAVIAMKIGSQDYIPKRVVTPQALKRTIERASERSKLMQKMEEYRRDLERSNQDLERFVSVAVHDLKSPLRAISQHLKLVHDRTRDKLDETTQKSIAFAVDGAERMRRLLDSLFEYSRVGFESRSPVAINCNLVLDSVKANLAGEIADKSAVITSDVLPTLIADNVQFMQLLQNLIYNAIKFCKDVPRIHISAKRTGMMWEFSVRDNGIGIPPASQEKIFGIFKRLHSEQEYPGSGLGLAICERVVRNHGGSIRVESEAGEGSTFIFTLPFTEALEQGRAA